MSGLRFPDRISSESQRQAEISCLRKLRIEEFTRGDFEGFRSLVKRVKSRSFGSQVRQDGGSSDVEQPRLRSGYLFETDGRSGARTPGRLTVLKRSESS